MRGQLLFATFTVVPQHNDEPATVIIHAVRFAGHKLLLRSRGYQWAKYALLRKLANNPSTWNVKGAVHV